MCPAVSCSVLRHLALLSFTKQRASVRGACHLCRNSITGSTNGDREQTLPLDSGFSGLDLSGIGSVSGIYVEAPCRCESLFKTMF